MSAARTIRIAPSLLAADFSRLGEEIAAVETANVELLHLDIMDGHFVPNLSFGVPVVASIAKRTDLLLDAHLMIEEPQKFARPFVEAGAGIVTFHIEVTQRPEDLIRRIRDLGVKVGVALNPGTPADAVFDIIPEVDIVLVMTVQPGLGGQDFMAECLDKIAAIAGRLNEGQWLEVDGGISEQTVERVVEAGADTLVAGSGVFGGGQPAQAVRNLLRMAEGVVGKNVEQQA